MFWNSMWDDKHNFSKLLNEDEFLKICVPLFFEDNLSNDLILYLRKSKYNENDYKKYRIFSKGYKNINIFKFFKSEKLYMFFSKLWILIHIIEHLLYLIITVQRKMVSQFNTN